MASARAINYISYRRLASMCSLKNGCVFSNFYTKADFGRNALYSTKVAITKTRPGRHDKKIKFGSAKGVKENTKSAVYLAIIISGIGVTAYMFYVVLDELYSSKSANAVCKRAFDYCSKHPDVVNALGQVIELHGLQARRALGSSQIRHVKFMEGGVRHMRMKFDIRGIIKRGTVHLDVQEDESGKYVYRYLYVVVDDINRTTIKIEDNRVPNSSYSNEAKSDLN